MKSKLITFGAASLFLTMMSMKGYAQSDSLSTDTISVSGTSGEYPGSGMNTNLEMSRSYRAQDQVYKIKPKIDIPLSLATAAWSVYGFSKIYDKKGSTLEEIQNLRVSNINRFDRWAADVYSEKAADVSDFIFYGAMPLPLLFLADNKIRKDFGKISFLYFETFSITGLFYTGTPYLIDRYRPYAYNPNASMGDRREGNAKNSFFAGHVALVSTSTFFMAKVYSDYHPESKLKWVFYGAAAAATGVTGYLRHKGGRHFPSDILVGLAQGTLTGILVPHFHKNKLVKKGNLTIVPYVGPSNGLYVSYKL